MKFVLTSTNYLLDRGWYLLIIIVVTSSSRKKWSRKGFTWPIIHRGTSTVSFFNNCQMLLQVFVIYDLPWSLERTSSCKWYDFHLTRHKVRQVGESKILSKHLVRCGRIGKCDTKKKRENRKKGTSDRWEAIKAPNCAIRGHFDDKIRKRVTIGIFRDTAVENCIKSSLQRWIRS